MKSVRLTKDWNNIGQIIIYGYGNTARVFLGNLRQFIGIRLIIDNDPSKHGSFEGIPICTVDEAGDALFQYKIIILAETIAYGKIKGSLVKKGLIENQHFTSLERFICEWLFVSKNKKSLMEVHSAVTSKCTLKCKKCNMFVPGYKEHITFSVKELINNIDLLMQNIDYLFKYQIVGGEPFLNPDLCGFLKYIGKKYRQRIGWIRIVTNGTVEPSEELCDVLVTYDMELSISDYTAEVAYSSRLEQIIKKIKQFGVRYTVNESLLWRDFNFPGIIQQRSKEETKEHMTCCGTAWHGLQDGKLYYCNSGYSAERAGLFSLKSDDYVDLKKAYTENESEALLDLCLGELPSGYFSFCSVCGGCGEDNNHFVKAGEQIV